MLLRVREGLMESEATIRWSLGNSRNLKINNKKEAYH